MSHMRLYAVMILTFAVVGCATGPPAGVIPVGTFDIARYLGTWYEIARLDHRFERGLTNVTAEYSMKDSDTIQVVNRGYDAGKAKWQTAEGKAKFRGDKRTGSLKVSFFGPFYGGYHIVALDTEYQYALVAGPSRNYLWILARSPELAGELYDRLVARARQLGFPTDELIRVEHAATGAPD